MDKVKIHLNVNGDDMHFDVEPNRTLLELLRDLAGLTGSKEGCGLGVCGSCTVLMDGRPVRSCLTLAMEAGGSRITTVEGLADGDHLDPLQQAFIEHGAVQCGFCTPGMLMSGKALRNENPDPSETEIREALSGNTCRCTGYAKTVEAVAAAAKKRHDV
ncbi:MAG: (2Fe-2S)-binding protein [Deltaproteobacteria bacterium]|nr:(2Fe-2S)-binding protein [Deltaproteobacteria bacterium]